MTETANIVDQLKRGYEGEAWHGSALRELLADVSAERAAAKPLGDAHCIWEIVLHVAAWNGVIARRLGGEAINVPEEGDWPPVTDTGSEAWGGALGKLDRAQQLLTEAASAVPESGLQEMVAGKDHTVGVMLYGIIQHNAYHAGQIALLKKARAQAS